MCGIVSLVYGQENPGLGREAESLLRRLEYRGYDSTGAAFICSNASVILRKRVGAPSSVCPALGIPNLSGQRFLGQVRWATYGAVTDANSQPHHVECKSELVGAHNGNISNTDSLKAWLSTRGHGVVSDNDGEVLVHMVEEYYEANSRLASSDLASLRQAYAASGLREGVPDSVLRMVDAIKKTETLLEGSYAAIIADPRLPGVFAMKSGSSLYAGMGADSEGSFILVSSDLTSVLSKTSLLIPLAEGEGMWFTHDSYLVFNLRGNAGFNRPRLKRSKLSVEDTELKPEYRHFMEQEIMGCAEDLDKIQRYYFRDENDDGLSAVFEEKKDECKEAADAFSGLSARFGGESLAEGARSVFASPSWAALSARIEALGKKPRPRTTYLSDEASLLEELSKSEGFAPKPEIMDSKAADDLALMDEVLVWRKRRVVLRYLGELKNAIAEASTSKGRVFLVASGSSYHACLASGSFFASLPRLAVFPCTPGIFRSLYLACLKDEDLLIGVSQSGETKDLVDIFLDAKAARPSVRRACIVNNENSRMPQELSDFYLPLLCGPEIAVAATKSFICQMAVLYLVAAGMALPERELRRKFASIGKLVRETLATASRSLDECAERLYRRSSIHILGTGMLGVAKEGALKIREVALNHTEGCDTVEFKHGPNTILGKNTILSLSDLAPFMAGLAKSPARSQIPPQALVEELFQAYPLIFVCPPDDRDARITISQIHTHKIRGAEIFLVAERRQDLALAAEGVPAGRTDYRSYYIEIPHSPDSHIFAFGAAIALQYLAYRISVKKMEWLDSWGIPAHGVHPDAPKNVSKSITVD
ncbi:MAG TPA: SIS domain-containing protein [Rectinemataceae bacterium]